MNSVNSGTLDGLRWQSEDYKKATENKNGMLTQEDFFALLTKELSHQDPTKPTDNNEMISQMTAFSTTDGISKLNEQFNSFASTMSSSQALQASSLVGRSVLVDNNTFIQDATTETKGKLMTDAPAKNVTIYVENVKGEVVQTVNVGDVKAGQFAFGWDGKGANGEQVPMGAYRFRVAGMVNGKATELQAMTYRKVESVTLAGAGGKIQLNLKGGNSMALTDVVEVAQG
jgi:flagellar basal-body rod modification protein FlgD